MSTSRASSIVIVVLLAVGCAPPAAQESQTPSNTAGGTASALPSDTDSPTLAPSTPSATSEPTAAPTQSGPADIAEVVTTDLVMRSAPGTGQDSQIYAPSLSSPMLLYILEGPVAADGYEWYRVIPFYEFVSDIGLGGPGIGWVAAGGKDGEAWIAPWTGNCPAPASEELLVRSKFLALACFGGRDLTLEGVIRECSEGDATVSSWISRSCLLVPFGYQAQLPAGFGFYPGTASPLIGQAVRVTGHYDDAAAPICAEDVAPYVDLTPREVVLLGCRASFVATEITPTTAP